MHLVSDDWRHSCALPIRGQSAQCRLFVIIFKTWDCVQILLCFGYLCLHSWIECQVCLELNQLMHFVAFALNPNLIRAWNKLFSCN